MPHSPRAEFAWTLLGGTFLLFVLGAVLAPPDPFTQVLFVLAGLPVALLGSYLLAYRGGYAVIRSRLESRGSRE